MCGVFLDATFHGGSNDTIDGRGRLRRPEIVLQQEQTCHQYSLSRVSTTPAITFFPGVVDTGQKIPKSQKFIAGVNDTAEKSRVRLPLN
jgi:hypothetical protein